MGFCYFSKDFSNNAYTSVENRFIVKYMPQAEDVAVKIYLYGLYLCQTPARDFTLENCAEVLKLPAEKIIEAFEFWEDCDLVQIVCHDPFTLEYLPVSASAGRPKKVRYEKYADFNKELQRKMQGVGLFLNYPVLQKYMNFLQESEMEQQAFLLIAEYCIRRSGKNVSNAEIFNKAKNFVKRGIVTYSQVEKALSDFNVHTADVKRALDALGGSRREPDETDYALFSKWLGEGFETGAVTAAAKSLKRGSMQSLDVLLDELKEKGAFSAGAAEEYLAERDRLYALTYKIAKNLGRKLDSPHVYVEEYTRKWIDLGFEDEENLCALALFCNKTERGSFELMDGLIGSLHEEAYTDENVQEYLKNKQKDLKLLSRIQALCGTVRRSEANLNMLSVWRKWNFGDDMILEAAARAANTAHPLAYINKILSSWKRDGVFAPADIPEKRADAPAQDHRSAAAQAQDERTERERYYAARRAKAQAVADRFEKRALADPQYKKISADLSAAEREAAKAEAFGQEGLAGILARVEELRARRHAVLTGMGITEADLVPQYACKKCSDTGFLPDGRACDCYKK